VTQLAFQRFLALLKDIPGQDLLRIKGIFNFQDCEKPMVFHAVQHIFHPLVALPEWPLSEDHHQKKVTQLVFITHDMTKETLDTLIGRAFASTHTVNTPASLKVA
jgi:G3E family GTPase